MRPVYKVLVFLIAVIGFIFLIAILMHGHTIAVMQPSGIIAREERGLIVNAILLMLIVIIPVLFLLYFFAWHYRAGNTSAVYTPDWEHSNMDELVWWAIPCEIILVLGAITWTSSHELDPHKALSMPGTPLHVQVVALPWRWLFIYPEQGIATLNFLEFPVDRPIEFDVTADAPMNSFWIPSLGGQIYAMTGMETQLHLAADSVGTFPGASANYSGDGFASMRFTAQSVSQSDFDAWVQDTKQSSQTLTATAYSQLSQPSTVNKVAYYGYVDTGLFETIVMKFMRATSTHQNNAIDMPTRMPGMQ